MRCVATVARSHLPFLIMTDHVQLNSFFSNIPSLKFFQVLTTALILQEVRVRFSGFSYDQDEWVNVKRGVRERSIPLEPSECHRVKVGDLVLCFRVCLPL